MNHPNSVRAGQVWRDQEAGHVYVLATGISRTTGEEFALLQRRRRRPFIATTAQMLAGEYGWHLHLDDGRGADDARDAARWRSQRRIVECHYADMTPALWDERADDRIADEAEDNSHAEAR